jgi:DNA-binding NtrC family response regulator
MKYASLANKHVMIVEDEFLISLLIENVLLEHDCLVVGPFTTVGDALMAAKGAKIDLAILDVNLQGEKVYPVAEILTERGIPFVFLTGYGSDAIPSEHPEWWSCSKPFTLDYLAEMLTQRIQADS